MKRIVLASLACLPALGLLGPELGASAAERVGPDSAARECPQYGPGFVQVPGTATCIRLGGRVASEYGASSRSNVRGSGLGSSGRLSVDTRTDTAYGPLRSYVRMRAGSGLDR